MYTFTIEQNELGPELLKNTSLLTLNVLPKRFSVVGKQQRPLLLRGAGHLVPGRLRERRSAPAPPCQPGKAAARRRHQARLLRTLQRRERR